MSPRANEPTSQRKKGPLEKGPNRPSKANRRSPHSSLPTPHSPSKALLRRLKKVRLLLLDVDGVLTDGALYHGNSGDEYKRFDVKDGAGIYLAQLAGLEVGLLTGKSSILVQRRAEELNMKRVVQGAMHKVPALHEMLSDGVYALSEVAYMGDDILDLPVIRRVGCSACPSDAHEEVRKRVSYVCARPGGHGAVREFIELILRAQGKLESIVKEFWEGPSHA
jgi:3-deoxy-D-manno-octulosonate 8-phosphate phosphatase (KDO 8-P phosphatase)